MMVRTNRPAAVSSQWSDFQIPKDRKKEIVTAIHNSKICCNTKIYAYSCSGRKEGLTVETRTRKADNGLVLRLTGELSPYVFLVFLTVFLSLSFSFGW